MSHANYIEGQSYMNQEDDRVILLFDMDCFEVQVHEQPHQRGYPRVVVNSSDRILAVSYEAKRLGINRETTPYFHQATDLCDELIAIHPPSRYTTGGPPRPDTSVAREATARIVSTINEALQNYGMNMTIFEFSSNDEFYVDMTELADYYEGDMFDRIEGFWANTFLYNGTVMGKPSPDYVYKRINRLQSKRRLSRLEFQETRLAFGSFLAKLIVEEILDQTGYQSSVGIGSNKLMAKIASGIHKPGSITILAPSGFDQFTNYIKAKNVPGLGGMVGDQIRKRFHSEPTMLDVRSLSKYELADLPLNDDGELIGINKANSILLSVNGICNRQVVTTKCSRTSGVNRRLYGKCFYHHAMCAILRELLHEFFEKMEYEARVNARIPNNLKINVRLCGEGNNFSLNSVLSDDTPTSADVLEELLSNCDIRRITSSRTRSNYLDEIKISATSWTEFQ